MAAGGAALYTQGIDRCGCLMPYTCEACSQSFELPQGYLDLLARIAPTIGGRRFAVPPPRRCPECRYQHRILHRNEWNLYRRACDATGKQIVSIYSPDKPFKVHAQDYWWSARVDGRAHGREFDFGRPFFEQFAELQLAVPRLAIANTASENSEYTNQASFNKDCYLCACCSHDEGCQYGCWVQNCVQCLDCYAIEKSEQCYECMSSSNLYRCAYVTDSENCSDAWFCTDCKGCTSVFGCQGLRDKTCCFFNKQMPAQEWRAAVRKVTLTPEVTAERRRRVHESAAKPRKYYHGKSNENFSGDFLNHCKDVFHCFNCRDCRDVWNSQDAWRARDSLDITEVLDMERCYQVEGSNGKMLLDEGVINVQATKEEIPHPVKIKCEVKKYDLSAHADQAELLAFVKACKPEKVIIMHSDDREPLAEAVRQEGIQVLLPMADEEVEL